MLYILMLQVNIVKVTLMCAKPGISLSVKMEEFVLMA